MILATLLLQLMLVSTFEHQMSCTWSTKVKTRQLSISLRVIFLRARLWEKESYYCIYTVTTNYL